jgi:glutamate-ammonia-ligase adenylyltransferase
MQPAMDTTIASLPASLQEPVMKQWQAYLNASPDSPALPDEICATLPRVWAASHYVAIQCVRRPELLVDLAASDLRQSYSREHYGQALATLLTGVEDETALQTVLRRYRQREMVRIMWRDIAGWAELRETTADLSNLAEACIEGALAKLYAWQCAQSGTPRYASGEPMNLVVLGMGKLGAWELNVSSDIDLIFTFAADGEIEGERRSLSHAEFFTRLGQKLIQALDNQTADGFVFRVDMRLRPFGDSGALVSSFAAMESYYQIHGREWERYAMIKARVVAGDQDAGDELMAMLRPFIYRRYLDFGAYEALRAMKLLISREVKRKGLEQNVKLGAGGIREIEFIGQLFQLIRGGRDPKLTTRKILEVLGYLGEAGYLPGFVVDELVIAYRFLRTVEHRLQEVDDKQTHVLPADEVGRIRLAHSLGFNDWESFYQELAAHRQRVQGHFEQVFEAPQTERGDEAGADLVGVWQGTLDEVASLEILQQAGYEAPAELYRHLIDLRESRLYHSLSSNGRERLDALIPLLLGAAGHASGPGQTVLCLLDLLSHIARRSVYLALLVENPLALSQLVRLSSASPWISNYLKQYPLLLDELLDPRSLYHPPDQGELVAELARRMAGLDPADQELAMDTLRQFKHANVLRVAAADIVEALPLMQVSDHLTWIAEATLGEGLEQAWQHLVARHGRPPADTGDKGFAVIGYGKLGGIELGYGSDLDLVFLYTSENPDCLTDGESALAMPVFYARLGQRLIHVLTAYTSAGLLYEVDMRLRPDGASGMLVSNCTAFESYLHDKAWLWEHQALVRARPVAGDPQVGERFQAIRRATLGQQRDRVEVRGGIVDMRRRMREELDKSTAAQFDLKQGEGGMVDIEFLVQFGVLAYAHTHAGLLDYTDNIRLLDALGAAGVLEPEEVSVLADAYRLYRDAAHRRALQEQNAVIPLDPYIETRRKVIDIWQRVLGANGA